MGREPHVFAHPFKMTVTPDYDFVAKNRFRDGFRRSLCGFVCFVAPALLKPIMGLKIHNMENLSSLKGGAVTVSNHVHDLDVVAMAHVAWPHDMYFFSMRDNFEIFFIRRLIRSLRAIPQPQNRAGYEAMLTQIGEKLATGAVFQIFPEGSLRVDCMELRPFRPGAFEFACRFNVPVSPSVFKIYENEKGRLQRHLYVCAPEYPNADLALELRAVELQQRVRASMEAVLAK